MSSAEADLVSPMAVEIIGNFTANVPPNPQQLVWSSISIEREILHAFQQQPRLTFYLQLTQSMTTVMKSHLGRETAPNISHAELVDQEGGKFECPSAQLFGGFRLRFGLEKVPGRNFLPWPRRNLKEPRPDPRLSKL